jgi:hypothetical protein
MQTGTSKIGIHKKYADSIPESGSRSDVNGRDAFSVADLRAGNGHHAQAPRVLLDFCADDSVVLRGAGVATIEWQQRGSRGQAAGNDTHPVLPTRAGQLRSTLRRNRRFVWVLFHG